MRLPIHIPLIIRNVRILGPKGSVKVDMIVDTGAALTAISWSDLKVVGYDPAIVPERQEIGDYPAVASGPPCLFSSHGILPFPLSGWRRSSRNLFC